MRICNLLIFALVFFSVTAHSFSGYVMLSTNATDQSWNFLPATPASFDTSKKNDFEAFVLHKNYGFLISTSEFELNAKRATEPKTLNLTATKDIYEFFYLLDPGSAISLAYKKQVSERQYIDCYAFSGLVIGSCPGADLTLRNTNEKYEDLNDSLLFIDGGNEALELTYRLAVDNFFMDEFSLGFEVTDITYSWLTPLEDIRAGFLLNLNINGQTLGTRISNELAKLPQRKGWSSAQLNFNLLKSFDLTQSISFFYDLDFIYMDHGDYQRINKIPDSNFKIRSGLKYTLANIELSLFGYFYKNNLLGFEPITLNQRIEHYSSQNFGSIGAQIIFHF